MRFDYKKNRAWLENIAIVTQFGLTIAGCIVFCFFVGRFLDRWFGTRGIFLTIFTILGVLGGANVAYRQIQSVLKSDEKKRDPSSDDPSS